MPFKNRITINPEICHGKPCIRGMRYPVTSVLEYMASGMTNEEILHEFPELQKDDLMACLEYAAKLADVKSTTLAIQ